MKVCYWKKKAKYLKQLQIYVKPPEKKKEGDTVEHVKEKYILTELLDKQDYNGDSRPVKVAQDTNKDNFGAIKLIARLSSITMMLT